MNHQPEPQTGSTQQGPDETGPEPFDLKPNRPGTGGGWNRPLLIGCGVLLVLLGIAAMLFVIYAPQLAQWAFQQAGEQLIAQLPEDIPEADRERLRGAFREVARGVEEEQIDPERLQEAQGKILALSRKDPSEITAQEVRELAASLESVVQNGDQGGEGGQGGGAGGGGDGGS